MPGAYHHPPPSGRPGSGGQVLNKALVRDLPTRPRDPGGLCEAQLIEDKREVAPLRYALPL